MSITRIGLACALIAAAFISAASIMQLGLAEEAPLLWGAPAVLTIGALGVAFDTFMSVRWNADAATSLEADELARQMRLEAVDVDRNRPFLAFIERARSSLRYSNGGFTLDTMLSPA